MKKIVLAYKHSLHLSTVTRGKLLYGIVVRSVVTNIVEGTNESTMNSVHKFSSLFYILLNKVTR